MSIKRGSRKIFGGVKANLKDIPDSLLSTYDRNCREWDQRELRPFAMRGSIACGPETLNVRRMESEAEEIQREIERDNERLHRAIRALSLAETVGPFEAIEVRADTVKELEQRVRVNKVKLAAIK